jgi:penicillin-binding protein 1C
VPSRRLLSPAAAWYVADILKDAPPPASAKGGGIAYKTGTSYGYRDAWAAGFDGRHTIVVWVGRADATATPGLTGRGAAAPLLFDAFARLADRPAPLPPAPAGVIRSASGALPLPLRRFKAPGEEAPAEGPFLEAPLAIAFPQDRMEIATEPGEAPEIVLRAEGGALPLVWLVDGAPIESDPARRDVVWEPAGRGFATVTVIDARGRTERIAIRVR